MKKLTEYYIECPNLNPEKDIMYFNAILKDNKAYQKAKNEYNVFVNTSQKLSEAQEKLDNLTANINKIYNDIYKSEQDKIKASWEKLQQESKELFFKDARVELDYSNFSPKLIEYVETKSYEEGGQEYSREEYSDYSPKPNTFYEFIFEKLEYKVKDIKMVIELCR